MGTSLHYWSIPPESNLFKRLQNERPFASLMANLFSYGNGVFSFFDDIDPEEQEEILEGLVDGNEVKIETLQDFRRELDRTRSSNPGVEKRTTNLEKTSHLIEDRLLQELQPRHGEKAKGLVWKLLFGDQVFGKDLDLSNEEILGFVSSLFVKEGAEILNQIKPESLFKKDGGWEEYHLKSYARWRQLYLDASQNNEVIFVGTC